MRKLATLGFLVAFALSPSAHADVKKAFKIENVKMVAEGHEFTEGPTLDDKGNILFTSPRQNAILRHSIKDGSNTEFYQGEDAVSALFFRDGKLFATQGDLDRVIATPGKTCSPPPVRDRTRRSTGEASGRSMRTSTSRMSSANRRGTSRGQRAAVASRMSETSTPSMAIGTYQAPSTWT